MAAAMANGRTKEWVRPTTTPVSHAAAMPERLPMPFYRLVQRPAASGPASVWVMAQWFDV
jgi:hypothetical protein